MNKTTKIAILGGGVSGLTVANELINKPNIEVDVYEQSDCFGGLNKSLHIDDYVFDIGSFLYTDQHNFIKNFPFLKEHYPKIKSNPVSIRPNYTLDKFPLTFKGYYKNFGLFNFIKTGWSLLYAKLRYRNHKTLPAYCKYFLGFQLYEKSGLKNYIERLYCLNDYEVDLEFAKQRMQAIENLSLRKYIFQNLKQKSNSVEEYIKKSKFVRPIEGFGLSFDLIHKHLVKHGVNALLNAKISKIEKIDNQFIIHYNGDKKKRYDRIVSTIPIPVIMRLANLPIDFHPKTVNLFSIFFTGNIKIDSDVIYNYTNEADWKRLIVLSKYYGKKNNMDYFTAEITTKKSNPEDLAQLVENFKSHIKKLNICTGEINLIGQHLTKNAYPVFLKGMNAKIQKERNKIFDFGIDIVGRQGNFQYLSSDSSSKLAREFVQKNFN